MPNIRDIADLAHVSHTTVSRYINNSGYVSPKTAALIKEAIQQLNYRPNKLAQALNAQVTGNIAMIVGDIANPITAKYTKGVEEVAAQNNSSLIICNTGFDHYKEARYIVSQIEKRVDGIIIASSGKNEEYIQEINARNIPLVFITRKLVGYEGDYVGFNDFDCSYTVVQHLIEKKHKKIAIVCRDYEKESHHGRLAGYTSALRDNQLEVADEWIIPTGANMESGYSAAERLLSLPWERRPTAIYTVVNPQTAGCLLYCIENGIRVPENLAVASFESFDSYDNLIKIPITANILPAAELGVTAAKLLFERIYSKDPISPRDMVLNCKFVIRAST